MHSTCSLIIGALALFAPAAGAQTLLFTEPGDAAGDWAGGAVAFVGDLDMDGAVDFAIGSPLNDVGGNSAGMVRVYSGRTRLPLHTWYGGANNERFGSSIAGAGDTDGDGHADVLVGAPGGNYADVLSGQTGLQLYRLTASGGSFGWSVAGGGEVDGDGFADLLVGAPKDSSGGLTGAGALHVFSGAGGAPIRTHLGTTCGSSLGWSASFYGDVDGDGRDEYAAGLVSSIGCSPIPSVRAYVGATGALLWTNSAGAWYDQLGYSLASLADVTGDGIPEVIAGAPQDPGVGCGPCNGKGFVRLLDGASGAQLWQVNGVFTYSGLGIDVTAIGDLDGDGYEDLATSQPESDGGGGSTRPVQLRSGVSGALLLEIPPPLFDDGFGRALAAGDANDDGLRDLLIGTPRDDAAGTDSGATYAYTSVLEVLAYCTAKPNSQGCTPSIFSTGTPSLTTTNFRVRAKDVLNQKFGLLFWSRKPRATPFLGGYLCVEPPLVRTPVQSSGGNPPPDDCSGQFSFHVSTPYMNAQGIAPGDQIYCQYWYRDPAQAMGTGLTDGLAFRVLP